MITPYIHGDFIRTPHGDWYASSYVRCLRCGAVADVEESHLCECDDPRRSLAVYTLHHIETPEGTQLDVVPGHPSAAHADLETAVRELRKQLGGWWGDGAVFARVNEALERLDRERGGK